MRWLLKKGEKFTGSTESVLRDDGKVQYSGYLYNGGGPDLTLAEYEKNRGHKYRVLTDAQLNGLMREFTESQRTPPEPITEARWYEMLEILPPSRWHTVAGAEVFHVCERLYGNLVSWFVRCGDSYFEMVQDARISDADLADLIKKAA